MGRILTGDQKVADSVLENAFVRARSAIRPGNSLITASDIFKLGFDAFDDAVRLASASISSVMLSVSPSRYYSWKI
jgi:hypothetical protein